ncbi:alpha/beta hydrolase [Bacterioplanes sanyensis]|uniref:Alpha/beta hydrolase n=1 Tax=Bacterioplanes sanyensis TaxID=1249553 RepID=A0A222FLK9_9GAMM|nr:alpha/beta fold hydrolase [Bacterioplanes sanyensis]ASP39404.1 alpha/beta hydrolase [Bacterioplanes sanyensis]
MASEQEIWIEGQHGLQLEGRWLQADADAGLLMCHPHPLFDGTMNNKVVTSMTRSAARLGLSTLRFNFRGVGASQGEHDHGDGEQQDVLAAIRHAKGELGWSRLLLGGFSFGAGMACLAAAAAADDIDGLFLIAPAVHHFDAPSTLPQQFDTHVYMGDADEVVPFDEVDDWVARVVPQPHWEVFEQGGHFFHGRLADLQASAKRDIEQLLAG